MSCGYLAASFCAIMGDILAARWQNTVLCVIFWLGRGKILEKNATRKRAIGGELREILTPEFR
jgi:hypothetical protein